jgi:hypothetical protein
MATTELDIKKRAMIEALEKTLGIVTQAANMVGIHRTTHYLWLEQDEVYKQAVEGITDIALDFAEGKLHQRIKDDSDTAIIFYLKTKGKKRGYIERSEVDMSGNVGVNINQLLDDGCEPIK